MLINRRGWRYPESFRRTAVERFKCCENIEWLAKELGVPRQTLYRWHEESEPAKAAKSANPRSSSPQNNLGATRGPIRFELVRRCGKWDKQNRTSLELCPGLTCQDLSRKRSSFLLKAKSN
jgi:hypothetical protein